MRRLTTATVIVLLTTLGACGGSDSGGSDGASASAKPVAVLDPCKLLTVQQVGPVLGGNATLKEAPGGGCSFDQEDDIAYLADHEVGEAPDDPGTYEGGDGKPMHPAIHNKWCMRECERSEFIEPGRPVRYEDYTKRHYNQPWKHEDADPDPMIDTGQTYTPSRGPDRMM